MLIILGLAIQNHFKAIDLKMGKTGKHSKHRQSLVTLSRRHSMVQMLENLELDGPNPVRIHHPPTNHPLPQTHMSTSARVSQKLFILINDQKFNVLQLPLIRC